MENLGTELEAIIQQKEIMKQQISDLQLSYNEILVMNEKQARQLNAKDQLIKQIKEQEVVTVSKLKKDLQELDARKQTKVERLQMRYEELRSLTADAYVRQCQLQDEHQKLELENYKNLKVGLDYQEQLQTEKQTNEELRKLCEIKSEQITTQESTIACMDNQIEQLQLRVTDKTLEVQQLTQMLQNIKGEISERD